MGRKKGNNKQERTKVFLSLKICCSRSPFLLALTEHKYYRQAAQRSRNGLLLRGNITQRHYRWLPSSPNTNRAVKSEFQQRIKIEMPSTWSILWLCGGERLSFRWLTVNKMISHSLEDQLNIITGSSESVMSFHLSSVLNKMYHKFVCGNWWGDCGHCSLSRDTFDKVYQKR